jgi:hypothetical protein
LSRTSFFGDNWSDFSTAIAKFDAANLGLWRGGLRICGSVKRRVGWGAATLKRPFLHRWRTFHARLAPFGGDLRIGHVAS